MVRTQIQLTEEQYRGLKRWSRRLGISLAEAVRRCVDEKLLSERSAGGRELVLREALEVCGKYADPAGKSRVAKDHDRHLDEGYGR